MRVNYSSTSHYKDQRKEYVGGYNEMVYVRGKHYMSKSYGTLIMSRSIALTLFSSKKPAKGA